MTKDIKSFCKSVESHHVHMCSLSAEGRQDMVACLNDPAEYKCGNCGAKARLAENVCDPVQLPEIENFGDGADNQNLQGHSR